MLTILTGDAIEQLRTLPDESVQCCVTSPPYWGLRDYGTAAWEGGEAGCDHLDPKATQRNDTSKMYGDCGKCGAKRIDSQLGLEKTPEEYVARMVEIFREVRRVLRRDGTLWLNLGDSYAGQNCGSQYITENTPSMQSDELLQIRMLGANATDRKKPTPASIGLKSKDMCGIPWRVAFALQADGWWLRSDIIWAKPNPMPESVTDRPTKAHEYLFLLSKSASYYYDSEAIPEPHAEPWRGQGEAEHYTPVNSQGWNGSGFPIQKREYNPAGRNKRSVWTVATAPYPEAHFATYPPDLIKPCIMAGTSAKGCCAKCGAPWERVVERGLTDHDGNTDCAYDKGTTANRLALLRQAARERGGEYSNGTQTLGWQPTCKHSLGGDVLPCTVLDPFAGSGTTGAVALELGRKAILIELNSKYVELIRQRCDITPGLQLA